MISDSDVEDIKDTLVLISEHSNDPGTIFELHCDSIVSFLNDTVAILPMHQKMRIVGHLIRFLRTDDTISTDTASAVFEHYKLNRKPASVAQSSVAQADPVQQQQPQGEGTAPAAATNLVAGVAFPSLATNSVQVKAPTSQAAAAQMAVAPPNFVNITARRVDLAPAAAAAAQVGGGKSIRNSWISTDPEVVPELPEPPVPAVSYVVAQSTSSISVLSKKSGWNSGNWSKIYQLEDPNVKISATSLTELKESISEIHACPQLKEMKFLYSKTHYKTPYRIYRCKCCTSQHNAYQIKINDGGDIYWNGKHHVPAVLIPLHQLADDRFLLCKSYLKELVDQDINIEAKVVFASFSLLLLLLRSLRCSLFSLVASFIASFV
jgi:LysM repeat protein